jgi:phosphatidylinositol kinase/protein kinase (PI-3  family)
MSKKVLIVDDDPDVRLFNSHRRRRKRLYARRGAKR